MNPELCEECKSPAVVGWGNPPIYLCDEHFDAKLVTPGVIFDRPVLWLDGEAQR